MKTGNITGFWSLDLVRKWRFLIHTHQCLNFDPCTSMFEWTELQNCRISFSSVSCYWLFDIEIIEIFQSSSLLRMIRYVSLLKNISNIFYLFIYYLFILSTKLVAIKVPLYILWLNLSSTQWLGKYVFYHNIIIASILK